MVKPGRGCQQVHRCGTAGDTRPGRTTLPRVKATFRPTAFLRARPSGTNLDTGTPRQVQGGRKRRVAPAPSGRVSPTFQ